MTFKFGKSLISSKIFHRVLCLLLLLLFCIGELRAQVVIKDRVEVEKNVKHQLNASSLTVPSDGLVRIRYTYAERSGPSWINDCSTKYTLAGRTFRLNTPNGTIQDVVENRLGDDTASPIWYNTIDNDDLSEQDCIDGWSDPGNSDLFLACARVSHYIPVNDKPNTRIVGSLSAGDLLTFDFDVEGEIRQPHSVTEVLNDGVNWSYSIDYIGPQQIPPGAPQPNFDLSEDCPRGYWTLLGSFNYIERYSDRIRLQIETVDLDFEIIPEDDIVYEGSGTRLALSTDLTGFTENLNLKVSDPTQGYLALMEVDENGFENLVEQGEELLNIPFADVEENSTTNRFVLFVAGELPAGKQAGNFFGENSVIQNEPNVQLFAYLFAEPDVVVGYGELEVKKPEPKILSYDADLNDYTEASFLEIGLWENGFVADASGVPIETGGLLEILNDEDGSFVTEDASRFIIEVTDPSKDEDELSREFISVSVKSLDTDGDLLDEEHVIKLGETGNNTGVFRSAPQLMVLDNMVTQVDEPDLIQNPGGYVDQDDQFAAHNGMNLLEGYDGYVGIAADEVESDPTHKGEISGSFVVEYNGRSEEAVICDPANVKHLDLRITVFNEPFEDFGYVTKDSNGDDVLVGYRNGVFDWEGKGEIDAATALSQGKASERYKDFYFSGAGAARLTTFSEMSIANTPATVRGPVIPQATLKAHVDIAKVLWSQACVNVRWDEQTIIKDAPLIDGIDVLMPGIFRIFDDSNLRNKSTWIESIYAQNKSTMSHDFLDMYVVGNDIDSYNSLLQRVVGAGAFVIGPDFPVYDEIPAAQIHDGVNTYVVVSRSGLLNLDGRTIAHEIGHVITGWGDNVHLFEPPEVKNRLVHKGIFFPQPSGGSGADNYYIGTFRRLTKATIDRIQSFQSPYLK